MHRLSHSTTKKSLGGPNFPFLSMPSFSAYMIWCNYTGKKKIRKGIIDFLGLLCFWECQCRLLAFQANPSSRGLFSSVTQSCPTLCDPIIHSTPGLPGHHQLPEFTQTHVHQVSDAIQPSHPLLSPSPPAPNPSQHQSLFQWVNSLHEVAKVLEFQL